MSNIIIIGFTTEGTTDVRFLESVIRRTFDEVSLECHSDIDIHSIEHVETDGDSFNQQIVNASKKSIETGIMALCIHTDADNKNDQHVFQHKINPAFNEVKILEEQACKNLVAVVPVCMVEAWMLADTELLKAEIGTDKTTNELGLNRSPEDIADPKALISEALRIALEDDTKRKRRRITIGDLYQPLGRKISLHALEKLPSYNKFKEAVRESYRSLNYLY